MPTVRIPHKLFWIILVISTNQHLAEPITNSRAVALQRNYRRHVGGGSPVNDWEIGLREAVHQTLLKEHFNNPSLHDQIIDAPFFGKQNEATPFGDIAVIARGQLYANPHGYQFVQDPHQYSCEDCHNGRTRCSPHQCEVFNAHGKERLLALWSVKRIRRRDQHYGHRFELAYTVSPVRDATASRHGKFDYNIPGHVFVIKSDPRFVQGYQVNNADGRDRDKWYHNKHQQATQQYPTVAAYPDGILIGLHSGYLPPRTSTPTYQIPSTTDPKEIALYQTLLESLASKTTLQKDTHTFTITTANTVPLIPTTNAAKSTTFFPTSTTEDTTYLQLATGHLVPITEVSPPVQKLPVYTPVRHPITTNYRPQITTPIYRPQKFTPSKIPTRPQPTTVTYFTPVSEQSTPTTEQRKPTITYFTPVSEHLMPTTLTNKPTTVHYFTPVTEQHFTTPSKKPSYTTTKESDEQFDLFPASEVSTTTTITSTARNTKRPKVTINSEAESEEGTFDLFAENGPTEPMKPVTQKPVKKPRPDSINDQLPPPNKEVDTTVPYVTSTSSTVPTLSVTKDVTTAKKEITSEYTEAQPITTSKQTKATSSIPKQTTTTTLYSTKIPQYSSTFSEESPTSQLVTTTGQLATTTVRKPTTTVVEFSYPSSTIIPDITAGLTTKQQQYFTTTAKLVPTTTKSVPQKPTTLEYFYTTEEEEQGKENHAVSTVRPPVTIYEHPSTVFAYPQTVPQTSKGSTILTTYPLVTFTNQPTTTFSSTIPTTTKLRPVYHPTTAHDDFLIDTGDNKNSNVHNLYNKNGDYSEDDIFGKDLRSTTASSSITTRKEITQSDLDAALFGGVRKAKQQNFETTNKPKIIFSNFYEASGEHSQSTPLNFYTTTRDDVYNAAPVTQQSYSTSISFEVNKRNRSEESTTEPLVLTTVKAKLSEYDHTNGEYNVYKAELPAVETNTIKDNENTKRELDRVALQLISHAKGIEYLQNKTERVQQPKYKRRSNYVPKSKRGQRKFTKQVTPVS